MVRRHALPHRGDHVDKVMALAFSVGVIIGIIAAFAAT